MLLLLTTVLLLKRYGTQAVPLPAPTPTSSTFDAPIFARDNPSDGCHSRTVLDILWSCLATTFACTWVSVHPNVPWRNEGKWTLLGRRIYLMFYSILAPEFMIVWAFKQWRGAVMIREVVNEASRQAFPDPQDPRRNSWTTTHGHLLQMGGFRISCTLRESKLRESLSYIRNERFYRREASEGTWTTYLFQKNRNDNTLNDNTIWEGVLTIDALKPLLSLNLIRFPTITENEINDKSKGDALSKGVALLQLTWFIVQTITRAAQGLAITELELTTAALAGLNSVMYIFWWSKPRDVRFPVVIRTKAVEELLAKRTEDTTWRFSDQDEFDFREHLWTSMTTPIKDGLTALRKFLASSITTVKKILSDLAGAISVLPGHFHSFLSRSYGYFMRAKGAKSGETKCANEKDGSNAPVVFHSEPHISKKILSCMHQILIILIIGTMAVVYCLAFLFSVPVYVMKIGVFEPISQILDSNRRALSFIPMVFDTDEQVRVFSMMFSSENAKGKPLFSTASIAGALFGAVHCLAWHFSFPSHAEQIMWRTASLGIVGTCALSFVGTYLWEDMKDNDLYEYDEILRGICMGFLDKLRVALAILTVAVYPVSRLMLLVLAVTSLRSLPPSALDTVKWVEFIPHI